MAALRFGVISCLLLALVSTAEVARADAVEAPPDSCPEGRVPTTDHGGPRCELAPPDDCPPGYRGEVGGGCVLNPCGNDAHCEGKSRCREVTTCQEYRELDWNGWYWGNAPPPRSHNFFAAAPEPQPDGPVPSEWVSLGICGQDGPCEAPAECRPVRLCYPDVVEPPLPGSKVRPPTMQPLSEHPGGCGKGCTVSRVHWVGSSLFATGIAFVGLLRRRDSRAARSARMDQGRN